MVEGGFDEPDAPGGGPQGGPQNGWGRRHRSAASHHGEAPRGVSPVPATQSMLRGGATRISPASSGAAMRRSSTLRPHWLREASSRWTCRTRRTWSAVVSTSSETAGSAGSWSHSRALWLPEPSGEDTAVTVRVVLVDDSEDVRSLLCPPGATLRFRLGAFRGASVVGPVVGCAGTLGVCVPWPPPHGPVSTMAPCWRATAPGGCATPGAVSSRWPQSQPGRGLISGWPPGDGTGAAPHRRAGRRARWPAARPGWFPSEAAVRSSDRTSDWRRRPGPVGPATWPPD